MIAPSRNRTDPRRVERRADDSVADEGVAMDRARDVASDQMPSAFRSTLDDLVQTFADDVVAAIRGTSIETLSLFSKDRARTGIAVPPSPKEAGRSVIVTLRRGFAPC